MPLDQPQVSQAPFDEALASALDSLPERQRHAVLLLKQEDLSVREAASRMQVSEAALKVLAHRGYKALKSLLGKG